LQIANQIYGVAPGATGRSKIDPSIAGLREGNPYVHRSLLSWNQYLRRVEVTHGPRGYSEFPAIEPTSNAAGQCPVIRDLANKANLNRGRRRGNAGCGGRPPPNANRRQQDDPRERASLNTMAQPAVLPELRSHKLIPGSA